MELSGSEAETMIPEDLLEVHTEPQSSFRSVKVGFVLAGIVLAGVFARATFAGGMHEDSPKDAEINSLVDYSKVSDRGGFIGYAKCETAKKQTAQHLMPSPKVITIDCAGKCSYKEYGEGIFKECCDRCAKMDGEESKDGDNHTVIHFTDCLGCEHDDMKKNNPVPTWYESMAQATTCYHWQPYKSIGSWPEKTTDKSWYAYGFDQTSETVQYVNVSHKFGCVADRVDKWLTVQVDQEENSDLKQERKGKNTNISVINKKNNDGGQPDSPVSESRRSVQNKTTDENTTERRLGKVKSHDGIFEVSCAAADRNNRKQTKAFNLKEVDCKPCDDVPKLIHACCMDCAEMAAKADRAYSSDTRDFIQCSGCDQFPPASKYRNRRETNHSVKGPSIAGVREYLLAQLQQTGQHRGHEQCRDAGANCTGFRFFLGNILFLLCCGCFFKYLGCCGCFHFMGCCFFVPPKTERNAAVRNDE